MPADKKRKRRKRSNWNANDFRVILGLPERLAKYLRELLHLEKAAWDFCLDKIRQFKVWQEQKKSNADLSALPPETRLYKEWSKSKGRGKGRRYFAAPCPELKFVQTCILNRFLKPIRVHFCRHGNQEGASILTNARRHANFAKTVYSVDIINAFPTVFRSRVFANFKKPFAHALREFQGVEFSEDDRKAMLDALCDLVCLHDRLPQGPPSSPRILDVVCRKMDTELYQLLEANSTGFQSYRITAWADDITISSDGPMPEELRGQVLEIIQRNGFIPHVRKDKTKYFSPETGEVPVVTGLVINGDGRVTMAPDKVNQLRARLHNLLKTEKWDKEAMGVVGGTLGYIRQVYPSTMPSKLKGVVSQCEARLAFAKQAAALETGSSEGMKATRKKVIKKEVTDAQTSTSDSKKKKKTKKASKKPPRARDAASGNGQVHDSILPISAHANGVLQSPSVHAVLFSDGGSRGNPGLAAVGFVLNIDGREPLRHGESIGVATNNQAEYAALRLGLIRARQEGVTHITCRVDSQLVVDQLSGESRVRDNHLCKEVATIEQLIDQFKAVTLEQIPREQNTAADGLANLAMDSVAS